MKAISIKNPFAGLIIKGCKKYEVKTQRTNFRGKLAICSSQKPVKDLGIYFSNREFAYRVNYTIENSGASQLPNGFVIGYADLVDCIEFSSQSMGSIGLALAQRQSYVELSTIKESLKRDKFFLWKLDNPIEIEPIPIKGQLGIFNIIYEEKDFKLCG